MPAGWQIDADGPSGQAGGVGEDRPVGAGVVGCGLGEPRRVGDGEGLGLGLGERCVGEGDGCVVGEGRGDADGADPGVVMSALDGVDPGAGVDRGLPARPDGDDEGDDLGDEPPTGGTMRKLGLE